MTQEARPAYGSNIPLARDRLKAVLEELRAEYHHLADEVQDIIDTNMTRRFSGRAAPRRFGKLTAAQVAKIKQLGKIRPRLSQQTIANRVRTGVGRVSEVLSGLRDDEGNIIIKQKEENND